MLIEKLISPVIPILSVNDTGYRALQLMEENNLNQLPLVLEDKYSALVKENDLMEWDDSNSLLSLSDFLTYKPAVLSTGHPYDALRLAHSQDLSIVPIIDKETNYLGAITRTDLLSYLTEHTGLNMPGGIIVIEIEPRNYTLYEIARICENEDVIITNSQLRTVKETGKLELTIKTNRTDLQGVIDALERHKYVVKEVYGVSAHDEDLEDRFNHLMTYLNI